MNRTQTFRDTLMTNAVELGISPDLFRPLQQIESIAVGSAVKDAFGDAANGAMIFWPHSRQPCPLPSAQRGFPDSRGWAHLTAVAPDPAEPVWFIVPGEQSGQRLVFASTPAVIQDLLGNSHGFEYIVASQRLEWLFAEDHESCVSVAGAEAVQRLSALGRHDSID